MNPGAAETPASNVVRMDTKASRSSKPRGSYNKTSGPGDGGGDAAWRASVESRLGELRTDVRHLLIAGGIVALALVGSGWGVYTSAMSEIREVAVKQEALAGKIDTSEARITGRIDALGQRMNRADQRPSEPNSR